MAAKTEIFIQKARQKHGDKYDYSKVDCVNNHTKVCIVCPTHGTFWQTPEIHVCQKSGCNRCGQEITNRKNTKFTYDMLEETNKQWGNNYDFSKFVYERYDVYGTVICPEHGEFKQSYHHLKCGNGCPVCGNSRNVSELRLKRVLEDEFGEVEHQKMFPWLRLRKSMRYDFYLPQHNVAIEYQGRQHFVDCSRFHKREPLDIIQERDITKIKLSQEHGVKLYHFTFEGNYMPSDFSIYHIYTDLTEFINKIKQETNHE